VPQRLLPLLLLLLLLLLLPPPPLLPWSFDSGGSA